MSRPGLTLALAGDTMLGRGVADAIAARGTARLFAPEVIEAAHEADLFVLDLECCVSARGTPWPDPWKPFFFRAPPEAVEALASLGVDCVTLANNHALDYSAEALLDTLDLLHAAGIATVGAGADVTAARTPAILEASGFRLGVVGATDHPEDFAATAESPGVALAALRDGAQDWLRDTIGGLAAQVDAVLVTPHWGPNMTSRPLPSLRAAARELLAAGATLVAGHSAHVFHGVQGQVLYDLGDFIDDYAVDSRLRNDLGLLWLVRFDEQGPARLEAVPLRLEFCHTRLAAGADAAWIERRFRAACAEFDTAVERDGERLVVPLRR